MAPHFVLFKHAAGYGLLKVKEFEEVATFLPQVEDAVLDVSKFQQVGQLFLYKKVAYLYYLYFNLISYLGGEFNRVLPLQTCRGRA